MASSPLISIQYLTAFTDIQNLTAFTDIQYLTAFTDLLGNLYRHVILKMSLSCTNHMLKPSVKCCQSVKDIDTFNHTFIL